MKTDSRDKQEGSMNKKRAWLAVPGGLLEDKEAAEMERRFGAVLDSGKAGGVLATDFCDGKRLNNPFYHNYVFQPPDIDRRKLTWSDKLRVLFKPMLVQLTEDGIVYYKRDGSGRIYLFKYEARTR